MQIQVTRIMRWAMAIFYIVAGVLHLTATDGFVAIVPVPAPREVVLATGVCEIAGALALLTTRWREIAGIMLALYAVCVFPANIKHAFEGVQIAGLRDSWCYHGPRLAMQPVIVWWALFASETVRWPFARKRTG
jgi:uncharacterized membrane protein